MSSYNFMGALNKDSIKDKAVEALRKYGVGSCGPPGFYGTLGRSSKALQYASAMLFTECS
jgi:serine palmitoyltransferase